MRSVDTHGKDETSVVEAKATEYKTIGKTSSKNDITNALHAVEVDEVKKWIELVINLVAENSVFMGNYLSSSCDDYKKKKYLNIFFADGSLCIKVPEALQRAKSKRISNKITMIMRRSEFASSAFALKIASDLSSYDGNIEVTRLCLIDDNKIAVFVVCEGVNKVKVYNVERECSSRRVLSILSSLVQRGLSINKKKPVQENKGN